jgi:hypothetical protein
MGFNLVVWAWSDDYDSASKRRKHGVKYPDIMRAFAESGDHPAMRDYDFAEFEAAVAGEVGPEEVDGLYLLERYPRARVFNLAHRDIQELVPKIGYLARRFGLTSAEC